MTPLYFFRSKVIYFAKRDQSKCKFLRLLSARIKITNRVFFRFSITLQCHKRHNSFGLFQLKFYILSIKRASESTNWWKFMWAVKSLWIFALSHLPKPYKVSAKKIKKSYLSWQRFQIWHEKFGEFSPNPSKVWKFYFNGIYLSKVFKVWAKKLQRSYLSWQWTWMQNVNKPWPCGFKNGMKNSVNFH